VSTIVFCPHPEPGHVNPVLRIAKRLKQRGHRIAFAGPPDVGDLLAGEGMEFIPVLTELLPRGMLAERVRSMSSLRGLARLREARRMARLFRAVFEELGSEGLARVVRSTRPDVMVCDSLYPQIAVLAHGLGVPYLMLNTTVPVRPQRLIPPVYSHIIPRDDLATRLAVAKIALESRIELRVRSLMGIAVDQLGELKRLARRHGFPLDKVKRGNSYPMLDVPELVLCPREFTEFSVPSEGGRYHHVEPSIDLSRREPDFPWEWLRQDAPLIYCSLGSQSARSGGPPRARGPGRFRVGHRGGAAPAPGGAPRGSRLPPAHGEHVPHLPRRRGRGPLRGGDRAPGLPRRSRGVMSPHLGAGLSRALRMTSSGTRAP
jgi:zeaxanthin glucosyltransferase